MAIPLQPTNGGAAKLTSTVNSDTNLELLYIRLGQGSRAVTGNETRLLTGFVPDKKFPILMAVSYTHLTLPTKRIV